MRGTRITLVIGTRPEAIKLAPVATALVGLGIRPRILFTGQHPNLVLDGGLPDLPTVRLGCPGVEDPHAHVAAVAEAALPELRASELVLVQGDTSSALGGALAAVRAGAAVGHVEAGLRSHDPRSPWPEEEFRIAIDRVAALLFAPTELSAANLRRERLSGAVHVTGNTGIDALLAQVARWPGRLPARGRLAQLLVTCHRRESWAHGLRSIATALDRIAQSGLAEISCVLHPNPRVASEMCRLLARSPAIALSPACSHAEMLLAMRDADLILTDSGGMQEESAALGVPVLVLRDRTERPEAVAAGTAALVGTDAGRIVAAVSRLLDNPRALARMRRTTMPFGDGHAASRIADIVEQWLGGADAASGTRVGEPNRLTLVNARGARTR